MGGEVPSKAKRIQRPGAPLPTPDTSSPPTPAPRLPRLCQANPGASPSHGIAVSLPLRGAGIQPGKSPARSPPSASDFRWIPSPLPEKRGGGGSGPGRDLASQKTPGGSEAEGGTGGRAAAARTSPGGIRRAALGPGVQGHFSPACRSWSGATPGCWRGTAGAERRCQERTRRDVKAGGSPACPSCDVPLAPRPGNRGGTARTEPRPRSRDVRGAGCHREPLRAPRGAEGARTEVTPGPRGSAGHGGTVGLGHRRGRARGSPAAVPIPARARSPSGEAGGFPAGSGRTPPRPGPARLFREGARGCRCFRAPLSAAPPAGPGRGAAAAPRRRREGRALPTPRPPSPSPDRSPLSPGSPSVPEPPEPPPRYLRAAPRAAVMPRAPRPPRAATAPAHWPPGAAPRPSPPAHWPHTSEPRPLPPAHWPPAAQPRPRHH